MSALPALETYAGALSPANEAALRELVTTIDYAEGLTLLFARCNVPVLRNVLAAEARRRLGECGIAVVEIDLEAGDLDLRRRLREQVAGRTDDGGRRAVFLYGLEHSIPRNDPGAPLLAELNMGRELFHRDAPYPLVFWLPDFALTALARGAPDFWAWRSGVFEFESEASTRGRALQLYARQDAEGPSLVNLPVDEKQRRRTILENLLADYQDLPQDPRTLDQQAEVLYSLGLLSHYLGDWAEARRRYEEALSLAEQVGNRYGMAVALRRLGLVADDHAEYTEARRLYERSLAIMKELDDDAGVANTLLELGSLAQRAGNYQEAQRLYQEALELNERTGDQEGAAVSRYQLGWLALLQGNYDEAQKLFHWSLERSQASSDSAGLAASLHALGELARLQGEYDEAQSLYHESLAIRERLGDQKGTAPTLGALGDLAGSEGNHDEAERYFQHTLQIAESLGDPALTTRTLHSLGVLAIERGRYDEAQRLLTQSQAMYERLGDRAGLARVLNHLGLVAESTGNHREARRLLQQSIDLFESFNPPEAERARRNLARLLEAEPESFDGDQTHDAISVTT